MDTFSESSWLPGSSTLLDAVALISLNLIGGIVLLGNTPPILGLDLRQAEIRIQLVSIVIDLTHLGCQIVVSRSFVPLESYDHDSFFLKDFLQFCFQLHLEDHKILLCECLLFNKSVKFFIDDNLDPHQSGLRYRSAVLVL